LAILSQEKEMIEQSVLLKLSSPSFAESTISQLRQEYQAYQRLFQAQSAIGQQYLSDQAASVTDAILHGLTRAHISLPERIVCTPSLDCVGNAESLPANSRNQTIGSLKDRFTHTSLQAALCQRLSELEKSANQAIAVSAGLTRYAIAMHMIYHLLPLGRSVIYANSGDDDIPNIPIERKIYPKSEITIETEVQAPIGQIEENHSRSEQYLKGELDFYLPQWVAFDRQGSLLANSLGEAEAQISSMHNYLAILDLAISIAPYMVADEIFLQKHYGILGQLVNQGRALANYQVELLCQTIKHRSSSHELDRGLSISLPFFNDQTLSMETYDFDVIPKGWVMFVPGFVVLAVRAQGAKVAQDMRYNQSTRESLLKELCSLERAFLR